MRPCQVVLFSLINAAPQAAEQQPPGAPGQAAFLQFTFLRGSSQKRVIESTGEGNSTLIKDMHQSTSNHRPAHFYPQPSSHPFVTSKDDTNLLLTENAAGI